MSDPILSGGAGADIGVMQWLINGLLGLVGATLMYIWRMLNKRVDDTEAQSAQSATDIAVLKSIVGGYGERFDRIENKLDLLLERRQHSRP